MASPSLRSLCLEALNRWDREAIFAENIIGELSERENLAGRDRSFLNAVVLGVLRNLFLLDHHLDGLRKGSLRPQTRWILRLGLYQVLEMRIPDHAAVSETVSLARSRAERNLVNAILRRATREASILKAAEESLPLPLRFSVPEFLYDRWVSAFGEKEAAALCQWNNEPAPIWIRANALCENAHSTIQSSPDATPHPDDPRFFSVPSIPAAWIDGGICYVQDPSTAAAPDLLDAQPGETILDACAAPGGKTCLLAEAMENGGLILATDADEYRLIRLLENLDRLRVDNTQVACVDWSEPGEELVAAHRNRYDAILIDAPCTNTGVMRRRVDVRWRLQERDIPRMAALQGTLLENCAGALKPGGRIVYSTCSLETEENEAVIEKFLATHPEFRCEKTTKRLPFRDRVDGSFAGRLTFSGC